MRHPPFVGFVVIMLDFLLQWPTILTLLMSPVLVAISILLARHAGAEAPAAFRDEHCRYITAMPVFVPRMGAPTGRTA